MDNAVFRKTMENVKKRRVIKLLTTKTRKNYLMLKPNYHETNFFPDKLLAMETKRIRILIKKPVYLGLSILKISKIVICEFWYDYVKPKYGEKAKLYYMDTDSFIVYIKIEDIYIDLAKTLKKDLIV